MIQACTYSNSINQRIGWTLRYKVGTSGVRLIKVTDFRKHLVEENLLLITECHAKPTQT